MAHKRQVKLLLQTPLVILLLNLYLTLALEKELKAPSKPKPSISSTLSFYPQLPTSPTRPQLPQLSSLSGLSNSAYQFQYPSLYNNLLPNRVISYGPSQFGYNQGYSGYNGFGNGYGSYLHPGGFQSYLFDPYLSPYTSFGSFPSIPSLGSNLPSVSSLSSSLPKPPQGPLNHLSQSSSNAMSPPFGYIEKQLRNPNENPADIAKIAPPKAIMTTASEVIGVRAPVDTGSQFFNFLFNPSKNSQKQVNKSPVISVAPSRRRPPVLSFNTFSNKDHGHFSFGNSNKFGMSDGMLKSKVFGKKTNDNITVKSINGTEIEIALDDLEDDDEPLKNNFISEPIMPESPATSPSANWSLFVRGAKNKPEKTKQMHEEEEEPELTFHEYESPDSDQPLNFLPYPASYEIQNQPLLNMEPIPLFTTDNDEDDKEENEINGDSSNKNKRVYHCPSSRDLRDLAQAEVFADPSQCHQFYYCKWGKAYVFKCPMNHFFNPYLKACDIDEDFACAMSLQKK